MDPGSQCYDEEAERVWKTRGGIKVNQDVEVREGFLEEEGISELTPEE